LAIPVLKRAHTFTHGLTAKLADQHKEPYRDALEWLKEENYRRIAYGRCCEDTDAESEYKKLTSSEQTRVDAIIKKIRSRSK